MSADRFFAFARRYFLRRSLPHGIISWRYLAPRPERNVRIHRRLWLLARPPRLPLLLFFLIEFLLWLKWVSFACWRSSWRTVKRQGQAVREREGISKASQFPRVLSLGLSHCIPPSEAYAFGLYRISGNKSAWNYIYTHELPAFHQWRNRVYSDNTKSFALLQDKLGLTNLLNERGVPTAPVLGLVSKGDLFDPAPWLQEHPRLFCKPRHGSASIGAFVVSAGGPENKVDIFETRQGAATRPTTLERMRTAMLTDDYLVQPFFENQPDLRRLSATNDAITVRLITELSADQDIRCSYAALEIPDKRDEEKNVYHIILPIEFSSGRVLPFPEHRLSAAARPRYEAFSKRMGSCTVPFWKKIADSAVIAHGQFLDVYAVAWDYVITPEGPYMLEGNTGWGTTPPQMLHGGLLNNKHPEV